MQHQMSMQCYLVQTQIKYSRNIDGEEKNALIQCIKRSMLTIYQKQEHKNKSSYAARGHIDIYKNRTRDKYI